MKFIYRGAPAVFRLLNPDAQEVTMLEVKPGDEVDRPEIERASLEAHGFEVVRPRRKSETEPSETAE